MRQVRRDDQHLARLHVDALRLVLAEPEAQAALEDVRQLLVVVRVHRDDGALLQIDVRDHHRVARDEAAADRGIELLAREVVPPVVRRVSHDAQSMDRWATFDCYGTLIDWNGGIGRELERLFGAERAGCAAARATTRSSRRCSARSRRATYRDVLTMTLARLAEREGSTCPRDEQDALADSLPTWQPFPEVRASLEDARARGWKLAILSNTDRDFIDASLRADRRRRSSSRSSPPRSARTSRRTATGRSSARARAADPARTCTSARASSTTSRRRRELGLPHDLDQPARRRGGAAARRRAALARRPRRRAGLARRMNVRPFGEEDFEAVVALAARGRGGTARAAVADRAGRPARVDVARRSRAATAGCSRRTASCVAAGWVDVIGDLGVGIGVVHPTAGRAPGSASQLLERSEAAARARGVARMQQFALGADTAAAALMASHGYRDVRRFFEMAIEQTEPPPPVRVSRVETLREEDAQRVPRTRSTRRSRITGSITRRRSTNGGTATGAIRISTCRSGS